MITRRFEGIGFELYVRTPESCDMGPATWDGTLHDSKCVKYNHKPSRLYLTSYDGYRLEGDYMVITTSIDRIRKRTTTVFTGIGELKIMPLFKTIVDDIQKRTTDFSFSGSATDLHVTKCPKCNWSQIAQYPVEQCQKCGTKIPQSITEKPTNPKDIIGSDKLPFDLWPATATAMGCLAFLNGALKYGKSNFRAMGVRASIYVAAAKRHIDAWDEGEENDPDDGVPHLSAALACLAILVEAMAAKNLTDDRKFTIPYRDFINELTPHVKRLKELHKNKNPKHWTINDKRI